MGTISLAPAGSKGLIFDIPPAELPPTAWTAGRNIRFSNGAASPALASLTLNPAIGFQPNWAIPTPLTSSQLASWLVASPTKLYAYITGILTDITRSTGGDYNGASTKRWTGGVLSGVTVANNGTDVPQAWLAPDSATHVVDLPNWPSTVRANCLRSFKQYLVALDVTKGSSHYPVLVKWSHPADPGTVPPSWDETDPTKDAGEYPLAETSGACMDLVSLRDSAIIYKTDSVYAMQYIGGTFIFKFTKIFGDFGIPTRDCAVEFESGKHFVFTGTDFKVHDGQTAQSIASGKIQTLLKGFSTNQLRSCYVVHNSLGQEVWFCYRATDDGVIAADTAITWSYTDGTYGVRELPNYRFIVNGRLDPPVSGVISWSNAGGNWLDHPEEWGEALTIPSSVRLIGLGTEELDWVACKALSYGSTLLERTYQGVPVKTGQPPDLSCQKFLSRLWPRFTGKTGDVVWITLGGADSVGKPISWGDPQQFQIGVDETVDVTLTNKMFALRIESSNTTPWTLSGVDADIIPAGVN